MTTQTTSTLPKTYAWIVVVDNARSRRDTAFAAVTPDGCSVSRITSEICNARTIFSGMVHNASGAHVGTVTWLDGEPAEFFPTNDFEGASTGGTAMAFAHLLTRWDALNAAGQGFNVGDRNDFPGDAVRREGWAILHETDATGDVMARDADGRIIIVRDHFGPWGCTVLNA